MSDFDDMREFYGSDDPDDWMDSIHRENMSGLLTAYRLGEDVSREDAEEAALELGWDDLDDYLTNCEDF